VSEISFSEAVDEMALAQAVAELGVSLSRLIRHLDDGTITARQLPGDREPNIARADRVA
jgi:hypothetical protein